MFRVVCRVLSSSDDHREEELRIALCRARDELTRLREDYDQRLQEVKVGDAWSRYVLACPGYLGRSGETLDGLRTPPVSDPPGLYRSVLLI